VGVSACIAYLEDYKKFFLYMTSLQYNNLRTSGFVHCHVSMFVRSRAYSDCTFSSLFARGGHQCNTFMMRLRSPVLFMLLLLTFANDCVTWQVACYCNAIIFVGVQHSSLINCDEQRKQARAMDIPTDCAICLEELSVDDTQLARPCDHRFHRWCLEMWLQQVYYVGNIHS